MHAQATVNNIIITIITITTRVRSERCLTRDDDDDDDDDDDTIVETNLRATSIKYGFIFEDFLCTKI